LHRRPLDAVVARELAPRAMRTAKTSRAPRTWSRRFRSGD